VRKIDLEPRCGSAVQQKYAIGKDPREGANFGATLVVEDVDYASLVAVHDPHDLASRAEPCEKISDLGVMVAAGADANAAVVDPLYR
jgi:hypothetical protein